MDIRCPHCGKKQTLSVAKLNASGGVVICPQCVSEFTVDVSNLPLEQAENPAPAASAPRRGFAFCPNCGNALPAKGLNFCPFCGVQLSMAETAEPAEPEPQEQPQSTPAAPVRQPQNAKPESTLTALPFVNAQHFAEHRHQPASLRFRLVAWAVIAALLALFVLMVWKGNAQ